MNGVSFLEPPLRAEWDAFVRQGRNSHFFFQRGFMEYHAERFQDCSLLFRDAAGQLRGVLPANRAGDTVYSHQGLSFGGLVVQDARGVEVIGLVGDGCEFLARKGVKRLVYKALPPLYHVQPSEDDRYALHRLGARLVRRELSSVIDLRAPFRFSGRSDNLRRARKAKLSLTELADPTPVIELVARVLTARHGTTATHSPAEMHLLAARFPANIRTFAAQSADRLMAGAIMFLSGGVAHTQYLANSDEGRDVGALDFIITHLIQTTFADHHWFSFGISTENAGRHLNEGLLAHKEGFGGHGMVYDTYELEL